MKIKKLKKSICAFVVACLLASMSVMSAFASPISSFPTQKKSNYAKSYTRMLQVMMIAYNSSCRAYINNAGGADGVYGEGTYKAVRAFQASESIGVDGICGTSTWSRLSSYPVYTGTSGSYYTYTFKGSSVLRKAKATEAWECKAKGFWYYAG